MPNRSPTPEERDERVKLPLDPETALRGLIAVNPTEIRKGQRWASKSDADDVIKIAGPMTNQEGWSVTRDGKIHDKLTDSEITTNFRLLD